MEEEKNELKNNIQNNTKNKIKKEITTKINDILNKNKIHEIDNLTVINLNNQVAYLGSIAIFDYSILETVENQLSEIFDSYGTYSIRDEEVVSCCKPAYKNISFKINVSI